MVASPRPNHGEFATAGFQWLQHAVSLAKDHVEKVSFQNFEKRCAVFKSTDNLTFVSHIGYAGGIRIIRRNEFKCSR